MPANHKIDTENQLIVTTWTGDAADVELLDSFKKYYQDIKSRPEYYSYNEIVDFRETTEFRLSRGGLMNLVKFTSSKDIPGTKTKLAIIITHPLGYMLVKMYAVYRNVRPNTSKELRIYKGHNQAKDWILDKS